MKKITVQHIAEVMNRIAPKNLAEDWDNAGLLVGNYAKEVEKIFICLDVSEENIKKAVEIGAQLIISHHPIIFRAIKNIRTDLPTGRKIEMLIKNDISVFSAHTNLDKATGGVNDILAEKIGLIDVKIPDEENFMRIGKLAEAMSIENFAEKVKKNLRAKNIRIIKSGENFIKKVGICSGAGSEFILKAKFYGAECFVTGDVKYHEAQNAYENKIHVIDAGHFFTENLIVEALAKKLDEEFKKMDYKIKIAEDETSSDYFTTI